MTARSELLFSQFSFAFQIVSEQLPLAGILPNVCLCTFIVDELRGIAVVQIIVALIRVGNQIIM